MRSDVLPRRFGRYVLFDRIGKGGMAEIYLARQAIELGGGRLCVVKQILASLAGDSRFSDMLVHEAKLAARLNHANVVQVLDLGREEGRLFIAMEYVEGFDLNDLLGRCSRAKVALPFELSFHVVREALRGLDYAHRLRSDEGQPLGIVHRDVSPSNLLLSFDGEVKVCDFGIARANDAFSIDPSALPLDDALQGKAGYMSPEHARHRRVDARADVFAIGIVLWELIAGRRMYKSGEDRGSLLDLARAAKIPDLPERGLPEEASLRAIVARALATDPDGRYPTAAAMLRDLDEYAGRAKIMTSALALGDWLSTTFGADIIARRRARERAVSALEKGAPVVAEPIAQPPRPPEVTAAPVDAGRAALAEPQGQTAAPAALAVETKRKANDKTGAVLALVALGVVAIAAVLLALTLR